MHYVMIKDKRAKYAYQLRIYVPIYKKKKEEKAGSICRHLGGETGREMGLFLLFTPILLLFFFFFFHLIFVCKI
jgi:hypothetical protein